MLETTIAGSLPKPAWLAEPEAPGRHGGRTAPNWNAPSATPRWSG